MVTVQFIFYSVLSFTIHVLLLMTDFFYIVCHILNNVAEILYLWQLAFLMTCFVFLEACSYARVVYKTAYITVDPYMCFCIYTAPFTLTWPFTVLCQCTLKNARLLRILEPSATGSLIIVTWFWDVKGKVWLLLLFLTKGFCFSLEP